MVCEPKEEGGLGIRLLKDFQVVFQLKHVWNLFANAGSLWVAWVNSNVFGRKGYWLTQITNRYSPTIKSMLKLKPNVRDYMRCEIGDGKSASFWHDAWTDFGPFIDYVGVEGPRQLRIPLNSRVVEATKDGAWYLP